MARDRTPRDAFGRPLPSSSRDTVAPAPPATVEEALRAPQGPTPTATPTATRATAAVTGAGEGPRPVTPVAAGRDRRWEDPAAPAAAPAPTAPASNPVAIVAFVTGALSFVLVPFLLSIAAIVLGTLGVRAADRAPGTPSRSLANVGRILGWISLAMWTLGAVAFALLVRDLAVP
jgi:hypothetical protein